MAAKVTENAIAGDILIIKELAKHLSYSEKEIQFMIRLAESGAIAVESLLEEAISKVGNVERCNIDGQDFMDGSDAKKAVVTTLDLKSGARAATIGNVAKKNGKLRIMVADPYIKDGLYYFVVPQEEIKGKHNLKIRFNKSGGEPNKIRELNSPLALLLSDTTPDSLTDRLWLDYRVNSFKEMCA